MRANTATATPTPMPAFAPIESPAAVSIDCEGTLELVCVLWGCCVDWVELEVVADVEVAIAAFDRDTEDSYASRVAGGNSGADVGVKRVKS